MRDERGQTAAEYLGVAAAGRRDRLRRALRRHRHGGRGRHQARGLLDHAADRLRRAAERRGDPGVGDSDLDGPSLTDHPLPVLPFPGSVTVSCTYDERDPQKCVPHGGPGVSVQASGEIKVERTPTSLDANGCPWQNLSLQTKLQLSANAEAKGAKAGGSLSRLPRPVDELQRHRRRPTRPTTSPTATARRPTRSTRPRSRRARASSSPRTSTRASTPRAPTARSSSRWATTRATACPAASSASARRRCG